MKVRDLKAAIDAFPPEQLDLDVEIEVAYLGGTDVRFADAKDATVAYSESAPGQGRRYFLIDGEYN